eukprot:Gb_16589 [translate_table: standard]
MYVEKIDGVVTYAISNEIHLSANYVVTYQGDVRQEITGVMYHEMTHVWQWNCQGNAPYGIIKGMEDYIRITMGLVPSHLVKPSSGDTWD